MKALVGAATFGLMPVPAILTSYAYMRDCEYPSTRKDGNFSSHDSEVDRSLSRSAIVSRMIRHEGCDLIAVSSHATRMI
jgi:hypothetical protein